MRGNRKKTEVVPWACACTSYSHTHMHIQIHTHTQVHTCAYTHIHRHTHSHVNTLYYLINKGKEAPGVLDFSPDSSRYPFYQTHRPQTLQSPLCHRCYCPVPESFCGQAQLCKPKIAFPPDLQSQLHTPNLACSASSDGSLGDSGILYPRTPFQRGFRKPGNFWYSLSYDSTHLLPIYTYSALSVWWHALVLFGVTVCPRQKLWLSVFLLEVIWERIVGVGDKNPKKHFHMKTFNTLGLALLCAFSFPFFLTGI